MRRMLVVAAATFLLGLAGADEPQKAVPGGEPGAARAAQAGKKDGAPKDGAPKDGAPKDGGAKAELAKGSQAKGPPPAPKGEAKPEKPCEPVRPCPID